MVWRIAKSTWNWSVSPVAVKRIARPWLRPAGKPATRAGGAPGAGRAGLRPGGKSGGGRSGSAKERLVAEAARAAKGRDGGRSSAGAGGKKKRKAKR